MRRDGAKEIIVSTWKQGVDVLAGNGLEVSGTTDCAVARRAWCTHR